MLKNNYTFANMLNIYSNKYMQTCCICLILIFSYYCSTMALSEDYFIAITQAICYQQFISLCFLPLITLITLITINIFDNNNMYILRLKNKKNYFFGLAKNVFLSNSFLIFTIYILVFIFFNLFSGKSIIISYAGEYGVLNIIYAVFVLFRQYLLGIIFSFITMFFYKFFNKTVSLIISFVFSASLYLCLFINFEVIGHFFEAPLYLGIYFIDILVYNNFILNVICTFIILLVYIIMLLIMYLILVLKKKDVIL